MAQFNGYVIPEHIVSEIIKSPEAASMKLKEEYLRARVIDALGIALDMRMGQSQSTGRRSRSKKRNSRERRFMINILFSDLERGRPGFAKFRDLIWEKSGECGAS